MAYKKIRKTKKKEDLPSFLFQITEIPQNVSSPPKTIKGVHHLGPIFFGCQEYQPMFHNLNLGLTHDIHKTASSTENILRDAFLPKSHTEKCAEVKKITYLSGKTQMLFPDPYPHNCPGTRKIFVPESSFAINFGKTKSTIEGDASQEIPVCCIRKTFEEASEAEYEVIELSDIWEKKRIFMSYKERIAHAHFPKKFVTLEVIGPAIPAAITITKLPSKRRTESELRLELEPKAKMRKGAKGDDVKIKKVTEVKAEEKENSSNSKNFSFPEEQIRDSEVEKKDGISEEGDNQELYSDENAAEIDEETKTEEKEMKDVEKEEEREEIKDVEKEEEREEMKDIKKEQVIGKVPPISSKEELVH